MHATSLALMGAALAAPALAQLDPMNLGNAFIAPDETNEPTVGEAFDVKWTPTLQVGVPLKDCSKVKIDLLYGPGSASLVFNSTIADNIDNTGSFTWTPASSLAPEEAHYGLKLSCVPSGYYQYTRLFGLKKGADPVTTTSASLSSYETTTSESTDSASSTADATMSSTQGQETIWTTEVVSHLTTYCPAATTVAFNQVTYTITEATWLTVTDCPCTLSYTTKPETTTSSKAAAFTPYPIPHNNATSLHSTGSPVTPPVTPSSMPTAAATGASAAPTMPIEGTASGLKATAIAAFAAVAFAVLAL